MLNILYYVLGGCCAEWPPGIMLGGPAWASWRFGGGNRYHRSRSVCSTSPAERTFLCWYLLHFLFSCTNLCDQNPVVIHCNIQVYHDKTVTSLHCSEVVVLSCSLSLKLYTSGVFLTQSVLFKFPAFNHVICTLKSYLVEF